MLLGERNVVTNNYLETEMSEHMVEINTILRPYLTFSCISQKHMICTASNVTLKLKQEESSSRIISWREQHTLAGSDQ